MKAFIQSAKNQLTTLYTPQEIGRIVRLLLEKWAEVDAVSFYADKDKKIPQTVRDSLQKALDRLSRNEPLEYVLGIADFAGMKLHVDSRVLIPRPETEELVEWVKQDFGKHRTIQPKRILDVCTGSGCLALAFASEWPDSQVEGWDVSEEALEVASMNAASNGVHIRFKQIDLLSPGPVGGSDSVFDLIVSNPPYIRRSESTCMAANVLYFEPHIALFVEDDDPLVFYRAIARLGMFSLKPGGTLYVEINSQLGEQTIAVFDHEGYSETVLKKDINGRDRFVRAIR